MRNVNQMSWKAALLAFLLLAPIPRPLQTVHVPPHNGHGLAEDSPHGSASAPAHTPRVLKQRAESAETRTSPHDSAALVPTGGAIGLSGDSTAAGLADSAGPARQTPRACFGRAPPCTSSL